MMKKRFCLLFTLVLLFCLTTTALGGEAASYQLGDLMEDFSATLSDGSQVSLYGLLKEKKAVLINFWASWCNPCKMEFPFMEQAYQEMSDEIGIIALSCEKTDTDEIVLSLKQELRLDTLPMGLDANNLAARFQIDAYPTSVVVDRNGVICFREAGSITDKGKFLRLFSVFTADDYSEPVLVTEIPTAKSNVEYPSAEAIGKALQLTGDRITVQIPSDETAWPFVPASDDSCLQASNGEATESEAQLLLSVNAEAGEALGYDYALSCPAVLDCMTVAVDGKQAKYYGGEVDWASDHVTFETSGTHAVELVFKRGSSQVETASAALRNMLVLSVEQVKALDAKAPQRPKTLEGAECSIEPIEGESKPIVMIDAMPGGEESKQTMAIVTGGEVTLRIRIGKDVDENVAYVADSKKAVMLANLPTDDQGFLFKGQVLGLESGNSIPYTSFSVCSSAVDRENCYIESYTCFASEADVNSYVEMIQDLAASAGISNYQMSWEYADGSPKQATTDEVASTLPEGMAEYRIVVTDEAGAPIPGAMIQLCDEATCQVSVTDEKGVVTHVAAAYPFEIHMLKAPDGYAADTETHVMPKEGSELIITLQKQ